jgi:imidazolonepropionase-like amidohydrolase
MTRSVSFLVALMIVAGTLTSAQRGPVASNAPLALLHANVVNVRDGRVTADVTILLRNGRIESIGPGPVPSGVTALDLKGKYVLPGLIDAHTHADNAAAFRRALESGVTTMRSAGVSNYADVGFHELVRRGVAIGPDVVTAGYHVRPVLAAEAFLNNPDYADLMSGVTTIETLRRAVDMNLAHGVQWIKVLATDRAGTPDTDPRKQLYTEDELRAIVDEAATKGVPVEAHAHGDEGAMAAVKAGVRSIEHGTYLSDATLQLMKDKGTYLDPTYTTMIDLAEPGGEYDLPALIIRGQHMLPTARTMVQHAHRIGVKIVTGGDTTYGPTSLARIGQEMTHFVELGLTPLEAIQAATITNAELLRMEKSIGIVEPGYEADLIAVELNPLEHIATVQDPLLVVSNGRVGLERLSFAR